MPKQIILLNLSDNETSHAIPFYGQAEGRKFYLLKNVNEKWKKKTNAKEKKNVIFALKPDNAYSNLYSTLLFFLYLFLR